MNSESESESEIPPENKSSVDMNISKMIQRQLHRARFNTYEARILICSNANFPSKRIIQFGWGACKNSPTADDASRKKINPSM
jgi:hypothetical protein